MAEITERLADSEEKEELLALKEKAIDFLKENNFACDESNPKEVATSLRHFIDAYKEQKVTANTLAYDKVDLAYGLGELFANAVMNFYQWEYFYLDKGNDHGGFAVVNPNKKWYIFVHHYLLIVQSVPCFSHQRILPAALGLESPHKPVGKGPCHIYFLKQCSLGDRPNWHFGTR